MINENEVSKVFLDCLFKKNELIDGTPIIAPKVIEGITMKVGFNPISLLRNKETVASMINELHPNFSNGWTFLNMCIDKDENQWSGSHRVMEELMLLGIGVDKLEYCCDKDMWSALPGNMPYIKIK